MLNIETIEEKLNKVVHPGTMYKDMRLCIDEIKLLRATFDPVTVGDTPTHNIRYRFFDYKRAVALGRKKTLAGEIIKRRSELTHSEVQFSPFYHSLSFSSTMEDAFKGCRFKQIYYTHPWWKTIEWQVTAEQEYAIWCKAWGINGKKYDLLGLGSFGTKWNIIVPHRDRYWCSESNAYISKPHIFTGEKTEMTPDEWYAWLREHSVTA